MEVVGGAKQLGDASGSLGIQGLPAQFHVSPFIVWRGQAGVVRDELCLNKERTIIVAFIAAE